MKSQLDAVACCGSQACAVCKPGDWQAPGKPGDKLASPRASSLRKGWVLALGFKGYDSAVSRSPGWPFARLHLPVGPGLFPTCSRPIHNLCQASEVRCAAGPLHSFLWAPTRPPPCAPSGHPSQSGAILPVGCEARGLPTSPGRGLLLLGPPRTGPLH